MAVVRADHQRILAHAALDQIRHVVTDLAGYKNAGALQNIIRQLAISCIETAASWVPWVIYELRRRLDEAEPELGKYFGNASVHDAK